MGYAQLDNGFWLNEKVDSVSDKAFRLYVRSISFASANATNGFISERTLKMLDGTKALADSLVNARGLKSTFGLWERAEGGWVIHDFLEHNRSKEARDKAAAKASNAATARWSNAPSNAPSIQSSTANDDAPSKAPSNATVQYREEQRRTVQSAAATSQAMLGDDALPAMNEVAKLVYSSLPRKFQDDPLSWAECEQFGRDFEGRHADIAKAIEEVRRNQDFPFPRNLRAVLEPDRPKLGARVNGHRQTPEEARQLADDMERLRKSGRFFTEGM